jgi:hypothetical protein
MKLHNSANIRLEKLYLDCIDDIGNCFIIYQAKLKFCFIKVYYSEVICSDTKGIKVVKISLKKTREVLINDLLLFYNQFLQIKGSWKRTDLSLPLFSLRDSLNHELIWNCHHPKALTEIVYEDYTYTGYGYAETLSLTIKPWKLSIEELRWGRFLSDVYTIIWFDLKGDFPQHKIFCNGIEYNDAVIEADRIVFGNGVFSLLFGDITVIRKRKLANIFSKMPWLKIIFNRQMLNSTENKYKAKSILNLNKEMTARGWSIYEIVTWVK